LKIIYHPSLKYYKMISKNEFKAIGLDAEFNNTFKQMALSNTNLENTLSFIDDEKYLNQINDNLSITGCIATSELAIRLVNKFVYISEDPRFTFYSIFNYNGISQYKKQPSVIHPTSQIHGSAIISEFNVKIGSNCKIGPNVCILPDVVIGNECVIQAGAIIGSEGFEYKITKSGIISVFHDGLVTIKNKVEIGANTCVDKGFSFRNTIIYDEVKIDNLIHVAHGVHIHKGAFIIAGTVLGGSTTVGELAWVGINSSIAPGITIRSKGFISMGAVVTKNVEEGQQVTGNFAIEHTNFLNSFKKFIKL